MGDSRVFGVFSAPAGVAEVEVELLPGARVHASWTAEGSDRSAACRVQLARLDAEPLPEPLRWHISTGSELDLLLPPGSYRMSTVLPSGVLLAAEITVGANDETSIDLQPRATPLEDRDDD